MAKKLKKPVSILLSLIMVFSMFAIVPLSASAADEGEYPAAFDLRERGVVTSVKKQDPWSTCWAFSSTAAAEISILSMLQDKGEGIDAKTFDLSEKHLAWFGANPITEAVDPDQVGEGMYVTNQEDVPNITYTNGAYGVNVATLFASGIGPVYEKYFPYQGDEAITEVDYLKKYPEKGKATAIQAFVDQTGMTPEELIQDPNAEDAQIYLGYLRRNGYLTETDNTKLTAEMVENATLQQYIDGSATTNCYAKQADWSIPEYTTIEGEECLSRNVSSGFTMVDGNRLPDPFNKDSNGKWESVNWDGVNAIKSELYAGHGVTAGLKADTSAPGEVSEDPLMSEETWAHYTYEDMNTNHMICIVGWDDDYSASNFIEEHQPPANGAWLCKNSWGSEIDYTELEGGGTIGYYKWGIEEDGKHTGYFWISYYDKSLSCCESMTFDNDLSKTDGELAVKMYDYMPSLIGVRTGQITNFQSSEVLKTANIFVNDTGSDAGLYSVSTKTAYPNATVKYSVYLLKDNAANPEDGTLLGTKTATYEYAGFHREKLDGSITIKNGEKYAIVAEETVTENGNTLYEYSVNVSYTKEHAEAVKANETENDISSDQRDRNADEYGVAVVNKGESFVYDDGEWTDWAEYEPRVQNLNDYSIDNFSIKAYMIAKGEEPSAAIYGDVDGDGEVTINDATYIQKYLAKYDMQDTFRLYLADVDGDGRVSILDVTCIQKYLAEYVAGYGRTGQPYEEDPVLTYCSKSAIDHLGYDNMAMIYNLISDDILPQVVSQLTTAFPTFIETDGGKAIGEKIGLVVYTSEFPDSVAASREALAYVSGFPLGTENYICMLGVNVLTLFEKDPKTGTYTFKESERANLENTVIHEMMHAFMNDYVRAGNTTDKANNYPGWFCEGIASAVENVYTFRYDQYSKIYGYSRGNGESAEVSTDDLLEFYKEYSEVYPVEGGPTHVPDIGTSDNDGNRISAYTMGYLATLYLSYLAQADNPTDYSSFSAGEFRTGLNTIFSLLHSGHTLDEVISSISGGMYKNTDDFTAKFVKGENGDGTNGKGESVTAEVSLGFCVSYLNYLGEVTTQLQKTDSNATANGSILLPLDTAEKSPIKAQAPEGAKENQQYFNIYRDPNIEEEDQPYVYSTVDPAIAYQSGGKTYTIPLN